MGTKSDTPDPDSYCGAQMPTAVRLYEEMAQHVCNGLRAARQAREDAEAAAKACDAEGGLTGDPKAIYPGRFAQ